MRKTKRGVGELESYMSSIERGEGRKIEREGEGGRREGEREGVEERERERVTNIGCRVSIHSPLKL